MIWPKAVRNTCRIMKEWILKDGAFEQRRGNGIKLEISLGERRVGNSVDIKNQCILSIFSFYSCVLA